MRKVCFGSRKHIDITKIITSELHLLSQPSWSTLTLDAINSGELSMNGQTLTEIPNITGNSRQ